MGRTYDSSIGRAAWFSWRDWAPRGDTGRYVIVSLAILVVGYLTVTPLLFLLISSLKETGLPTDPGLTLNHYFDTYADRRTYRLLGTSLLFASGTTAVAMLLGSLLAWLFERTDMPARERLRAVVLLPMAVPPIILAMGWVLLLSPRIGLFNHILMALMGLDAPPFNAYSLGAMVFVQGLAGVPLAYLTLGPIMRSMDPSLEEAAAMSGSSPGQTLLRVTLPLAAPAVGAGAAYLFVASLVTFDIPGILGLPTGIRVFSTEIFLAANPAAGFPQYGRVSSLSMVFLVILASITLAYFGLIRKAHRYVTVTGKGFRPRPIALGRWRYLAAAFVFLYAEIAVVAPLGALVWTSLVPYYSQVSAKMLHLLSLDNYVALIHHPRFAQALANSAKVTLLAGSLVTALAALVSWAVVRSGTRAAQLLDTLAMVPLAIPNSLLGLALTYVYLSLPVVPVYGTIWILVIAYVTAYLPFGTRVANGAYLQLHRELEEAAAMSGANWWQTMRHVLLPLIAPALVGI